MILQLIAKTDKGLVREINEDSFIAEGSLLAVADGMGGTNAGEVASKAAVEAIKEYFSRQSTSQLKKAILAAHRAVVKCAGKDPQLQGMGTTLILGWIANDTLNIAWSGDSRCYYFRETTGLQQLSKDHSYVQTLVDDGKITSEQAFFHPQNNIVLQSLGDSEQPPKPDTAILSLINGDIILLCSDGLSGMLTKKEIEDIIHNHRNDLELCCDKLISAANEAGGADNITVILAKVIKTEGLPQKKSRKIRPIFIILAILVLLTSIALYATWRSPKVQSPVPKIQPPRKTAKPGPTTDTTQPQPPPPKRKKIKRPDSLKAGDPSKDTIRLHIQKQDSTR